MVCLPGWGYGRWLYRIRPSVGHSDLVPVALNPLFIGDLSKLKADPSQVTRGPLLVGAMIALRPNRRALGPMRGTPFGYGSQPLLTVPERGPSFCFVPAQHGLGSLG
jgi:hypothetical protein